MYASGPAIEAEWRQQVSAVSTETWLGKPPKDVGVKDIASLVSRAGKAGRESRSILDQAGRHLGYALVSLLHAFDPEKVVIGGGVAQVGEPFFQGVRAIVRQHAAPTVRHVPILPAALGSNAALIGAAELAFQTYHDRD
jgi:glucokinase